MQESSSSENEESSEDEEMALFMRRFKKFVKKNDYGKYKRDAPREEHQRELAMSVVKLDISLRIAPTRRRARTRKSTKGNHLASHTRRTSTRPTRRSIRVMHTLERSGIPIPTPTPMKEELQPSPSASNHKEDT